MIFFYLKKNKNLLLVQLTSCHIAMTVWCHSDTCHCHARCHFLNFNLVSLFIFYFNLISIFVKVD